MATSLHQILAVEGSLQAQAAKTLSQAMDTFNKKPHVFLGNRKTLSLFNKLPENEAADKAMEEKASVDQRVTSTVFSELNFVAGHIANYWNVRFKKEATNQVAAADLVVDGVTIAQNLPATFLLGLESRLKEFRAFLDAAPTLDNSVNWTPNPAAGVDIFQAPSSVTVQTKKVVTPFVLVQATEHHPAQVKEVSSDVPTGRLEDIKFSGQISSSQKAELLTRTDKMLRAVISARQRANGTTVVEGTPANAILSYILGDKFSPPTQGSST